MLALSTQGRHGDGLADASWDSIRTALEQVEIATPCGLVANRTRVGAAGLMVSVCIAEVSDALAAVS